MPSLRKRTWPSGKTTWDIRYREDKKPRSYSIGETDRRTAEKIFNEFCRRFAEGKFIGGKIVLTTQAISDRKFGYSELTSDGNLIELAEHTRVYAESNKNRRTVEREQNVFSNFLRVLGNVQITDLTPSLIESFKATRLKEASASTINIEIRVLNTALNQAVTLGWLSKSEFGSFKQIKLPAPEPPEWLNEQQIQSLLSQADREYQLFLQFLLHTGCRRNEALGISWNDIDLMKRQMVIRGKIGKMGKRRTIPINDVLYEVFLRWPGLKDGLLFPDYGPNQVSMKFRRLARDVGIPRGLSLHSLRATFGSTLINMGVDIYTVSKLLGHSSVKVTEKHYLALDPAHVQSAINNLKYGVVKE